MTEFDCFIQKMITLVGGNLICRKSFKSMNEFYEKFSRNTNKKLKSA